MARMNTTVDRPPILTHEGGRAVHITPMLELRRSVLTALLWENGFYESGSAHAARVEALVPQCKPEDVAALAVEARDKMYLRHVPLFLVRQLARLKGQGRLVADTLAHVIQRPDEMGEYLAMYWGGKASGTAKRPYPLSAGSKRGLARAFGKFRAETLAKYDRDSQVKLRDVLRLVNADPKDAEQRAVWRRVLDRSLDAPDTWEVALSSGADKRATFERLLREGKLGGLAFLRNLRNMTEVGVDLALMRERFAGNFDKVLPFRFIAAANHAPRLEAEIEGAMLRATAELPKLAGTTALIVDVSGSMDGALSSKSELTRLDTAAALAILVREQAEHAIVIATAGNDATRIHQTAELPARRGMALRDAVMQARASMGGGGIFLVQCLEAARAIVGRDVERVIVLTDEQDCDHKLRPDQAKPFGGFNYVVNIATNQNGVGYGRQWTAHIDGWSERVLDFIMACEAAPLPLQ